MGLSLNIDMSSTAFIEPLPVIDFVTQLLNRDVSSRPLSDDDRVKNPAELDDWLDDLNPESKVVMSCAYAIPTLRPAAVGDSFQLQRLACIQSNCHTETIMLRVGSDCLQSERDRASSHRRKCFRIDRGTQPVGNTWIAAIMLHVWTTLEV